MLLIAVASLLLPAGTVAHQEGSGVTIYAERESLYDLMKRSTALLELGEYTLAIEVCNQTIKLYPQSAAAYDKRGSALEKLGMYAEALKSYEQARHLHEAQGSTIVIKEISADIKRIKRVLGLK